MVAALNAVDDAYAVLRSTPTDLVGHAFRVEVAARLETQERLNRGLSYRMVGELFDPPDEAARPGIKERLATLLRVSRGEVGRRATVAARIGPRRTLAGEVLAPELPRLAEAVAAGQVGEDHIGAVLSALNRLPSVVSAADRGWAEKKLVQHAVTQDSAFVAAVGRAIDTKLNPDGHFDDRDRAARRGLTMGRQGPDGMSTLSGHLTPEARAYFEAISAAVRPGHHLPGSAQSVVDAATDTRTPAQRCHDAFTWGMRTALESGSLGQHRGLPVTVIVTTTLEAVQQAAQAATDPSIPMPAPAVTGGGSSLPMRDFLRMASGAIPFLAVFDGHSNRPLYLARGQRLATADQRIICYARDRGCTGPNCTVPGYGCEVHHAPAWVPGGPGNANALFFACPPTNQAEARGEYTSTVTDEGRLAWTDGTSPPQVNRLHHPEELLADPQDEQTGEDDP